jgi:hypothetical protein
MQKGIRSNHVAVPNIRLVQPSSSLYLITMQPFKPLAGLLLLLGTAFAASSYIAQPMPGTVSCKSYVKNANDPIEWNIETDLNTNVAGTDGGTHKTAFKRVTIKKYSSGSYVGVKSNYMYTFSAGLGKNVGDPLYAQVDRSKGDGAGQQFLMNYYKEGDAINQPSYQYWVVPNVKCSTSSPVAASEIVRIDVWSRAH